MNSDNTVFILVRPETAGNVGAAARVLKNFGFTKMRLVEPAIEYLENEDKWMAVEAYDILSAAQVFGSLEESLKDVQIAAATSSSRLRGTEAVPFTQVLPELSGATDSNKVAFVFGNEAQGLSRSDLQRCHHIITVPTSPDFPVLNLAQSIGIVAYEFAKIQGKDKVPECTTGAEDDMLFNLFEAVVQKLAFTREHNHDLLMQEFRSCYQKARVTPREASLLKGLLHRIEQRISRPTT